MRGAGAGGFAVALGLALGIGARRALEQHAAAAVELRHDRPRPAPPAAPPLVAYLYRKPNEIAIRMAVGTSPATATERGIFGTLEKAQQVARSSGYTLAWQGAKDL